MSTMKQWVELSDEQYSPMEKIACSKPGSYP